MTLATIRDGEPGDINLVVNSWITSHAAFTKADGSVVRYTRHPNTVLDLVQRCAVVVACDPDDASQIYGWLCHERLNGVLVVHYIFVKFAFRGVGIARQLWSHVNPDAEPVVMTHAGFVTPHLRDRYALTFDPFRLKETR